MLIVKHDSCFKTQIVAAAAEIKLFCGVIKSQGLSSNLFLRDINDAWTSFFESLKVWKWLNSLVCGNSVVPLKCLLVVGCYLFYSAVHLCTTPHRGFLLEGLTLQLGKFMCSKVPGGNEATGKPTVNPLTHSGWGAEVLYVSSFILHLCSWKT